MSHASSARIMRLSYDRLRNDEPDLVLEEVQKSLAFVRQVWDKVDSELRESIVKSAFATEAVQTFIPGHSMVDPDDPKVSDFAALVADIRGSSAHLMQNTSTFNTNKKRLFRVHAETSAFCAGATCLVRLRGGAVTEMLGDGVLALFECDTETRPKMCKKAYYCGEAIIEAVKKIVNPELDKINIPPLSIGVGVTFSQAIVTVVGDSKTNVGKAIGQCVYRAAKLSAGEDVVAIDNCLKAAFPETKGGKLRFKSIEGTEFPAFVDERKIEKIGNKFKIKPKNSR